MYLKICLQFFFKSAWPNPLSAETNTVLYISIWALLDIERDHRSNFFLMYWLFSKKNAIALFDASGKLPKDTIADIHDKMSFWYLSLFIQT